jgi:hypothetical protein
LRLLFTALKQNLGDHKFKDDREVYAFVTRWVIIRGTDWYKQGIGKFVPMYDCFGYVGDYVEMQWDSSKTECKLLASDLKFRATQHSRYELNV